MRDSNSGPLHYLSYHHQAGVFLFVAEILMRTSGYSRDYKNCLSGSFHYKVCLSNLYLLGSTVKYIFETFFSYFRVH